MERTTELRLLCSILLFALASRAAVPMSGTEILWDKFGIAHVYAKNTTDLFYGYGWATAQSHGNLLLKLYGQSRGRGPEYFGESEIPMAKWLLTNGVPETAEAWYRKQSPQFRQYLDAFAKGINDYAAKYPHTLSAEMKAVLPVTGVDPLQHALRMFQYSYVASASRVSGAVSGRAPSSEAGGSNGWAVGPKKTAAGTTMLLGNPHLPWEDWYTYYEVHLNAPGIDLYGASQVGLPVLRFVFSDYGGFNQTVNNIDGMDLYQLTVDGDRYKFDGEWKNLDIARREFKVRGKDGSMRTETLVVKRSLHGPVVYEKDGTTLAMRVAGLDRPLALESYWRMCLAKGIGEFQKVLSEQQIPTFNFVYADRGGHIMYLFNGLLPKRKKGDLKFWAGIVPGDTSDTMWTGYHSYDELPKVIDPPAGYVQNTNDPPWNASWPATLDPDKYPAYTASRGISFRNERSIRLMSDASALTLEKFIALKHDNHSELADRVLPDLLAAVEAHGSEKAKQAAAVLKAWDRTVDAESRGAILFLYWAQRFLGGPAMGDQSGFAVPYDLQKPLETPRGFKDPAKAASQLESAAVAMENEIGALDTPWGQVMKFRRGKTELPANGGFGNTGIFRVITFGPMTKDKKRYPIHGETYVVCVEFGKQGATARALMSYGNSSQPNSPHSEDQLAFMTRKELRPVWRDRKSIEANLESREKF